MKKYKAVIFDLDGTLLDTLGDLAAALNRTLAVNGLPVHTVDECMYFLGYGARGLVTRALPSEKRDDEKLIDDILGKFRNDYKDNWNVNTRAYEGVPELLDALVSRNMKLAIFSNKPHHFLELCVKEYLSLWKFEFLLGQHQGMILKPDPSGAIEAAEFMGLAPGSIMFVGDSGVDMQTAVNAGMYAVGASWGYREKDELLRDGADTIIAHPIDLLNLL